MSVLSSLVERRSERGLPAALAGGGVDLMKLTGTFLGGRARGGGTPAGVWVDEERAMSLTAFWRGVRAIATAIGTLPINVYEEDAAGHVTLVRVPREKMIWRRPNPEVSRSVFWVDAIMRCVATGDSFSYVVTGAVAGERGRHPMELWPIETNRVDVQRDDRGERVYIIDGNTKSVEREFSAGGSIFHVQGPSSDGLRGDPPVLRFARSIGLALAEELYQSRIFGRGTNIRGYLSTEQPLTTDQAEALQQAWDEKHSAGPSSAGGTAVLGKGTKWQSVDLSPVDAQLLESRFFSIAEIGRMLGMPLWMLGAHDKDSSWGSGLEEQFRAWLVLTLEDWLARFQEAISDELLRQENHVSRFDITRLTRGKLVDQVNALKGLVQSGYDPAESLAFLGLPPIAHTGRPPVGGAAAEPAPAEGEEAVANAAPDEDGVEEPPRASRIVRRVERDEAGRIVTVIEEAE